MQEPRTTEAIRSGPVTGSVPLWYTLARCWGIGAGDSPLRGVSLRFLVEHL